MGDLTILVSAILLLLNAPATAADYRPVVCAASKPYVGAPLHPDITVSPIAALPRTPFDAKTSAALDSALTAAKAATQAPAITAAVASEHGFWTKTEGNGDAPLFFWASAGKTMVAAVILQLADEGRLSLDDPISTWVQGVPNGDVITVRNLLAHTSGLFSANEDLKWHAERRAHTLIEERKIIARHGAMFCPGERWRYSNTGYALLGMIIETVDGRSYADAITRRIIEPLELHQTRVVRDGEKNVDVVPLSSSKDTPIEPFWAGAAGPVVSSAGDMVRFWSALVGGHVVKPSTMQSMFAGLYPMFDPGTYYGLGVMAFEVPETDGHTTLWLGHAGGTPGAMAVVFYAPADKAFVAIAMTGDGSAPAAANLLLRQVR